MSQRSTMAFGLMPSWSAQMVDAVSCVAWSPEGRAVAVGSLGGDAAVLYAEDRARQEMESHRDGVLAVAWSPDGRWLAVGGQQASVCLWERDAGNMRVPVRGWVNDLAWAPRSHRLAVAAGSDVVVMRPDTSVMADYPFLDGTVNALAWTGGGRHLAVATLGAVHWLDPVVAGRRPARTAKVVGAALTLAASPDGARVAGGQLNGTLAVWDEATGKGRVLGGYDGGVERLSWRHDGRQLAVAAHQELDVWSFDEAGSLVNAPLSLCETEATLGGLSFHPTLPVLAAGGLDGEVCLWAPGESDEPVARRGVDQEITALAWSPAGDTLVVGTRSGQVRLMELER